MKEGNMEFEGVVTEIYPSSVFDVDVKLDNGTIHTIRATLSGKLRMNFIKILRGDRVTVEVTPYDLNKGRITWRHPK